MLRNFLKRQQPSEYSNTENSSLPKRCAMSLTLCCLQDGDNAKLRNVSNHLQLHKAQPHKISVSSNTAEGESKILNLKIPHPLYETRMEITAFTKARQDFKDTLNFPTDFQKGSHQISLKFFHWKPSFSCGRTDGRTNMTKLLGAIRSFANAPKIDTNVQLLYLSEILTYLLSCA